MRQGAKILICFGEGGHSTAFNRLWEKINIPRGNTLQLIESEAMAVDAAETFRVPRIMPKHNSTFAWLLVPIWLAINFWVVVRIVNTRNIRAIITTGPGIAIIPAIFARAAGRDVIFIESWCRFETLSLSARILLFFGARVYVQNFELLGLHDGLTYCGRL